MRLLGIDTCGPVIGVGLWVDGTVTQRIERVTRGAEARLMPWALDLCAEAGFSVRDLDGVGVSAGPGAFTGLRVGLAAATGVALGVGCPVWAGSSLAARAWRHRSADPVLSMLDARKGRVYAQGFGGEPLEPADVAPELAVAWLDGAYRAVGEGALAYRDLVESSGGVVVDDADDPGLDGLLAMAARAFAEGESVAPEAVRPVYLRDADAKIPKDMRSR